VDCAGCRRNISGWVPAGLKISNNINGILVPKIPPKCKRVWAGYPCQYGGARCEAQRSIDVRNWHRRNLLTPPGRAFAWRWARNGESASAISVLSGVRASSCATGSRSVDRTLHFARGGHRPWSVRVPAIGDVGRSTSTAIAGLVGCAAICATNPNSNAGRLRQWMSPQVQVVEFRGGGVLAILAAGKPR
jgi:hypothetical protein